MQREQFLAELQALANRARTSNEDAVQQSAVVLFGLSGAMKAGDEFLDAFIDRTVETIQNQLAILKEVSKSNLFD